MKKAVLNLNITQAKRSKVAVNNWVNTAMNAKKEEAVEASNSYGKKMEVNMAFCQSILNKR